MVCQVKLNSIKYLEKYGATDGVRRIIDLDKFDELNDKLTKLAEVKYGLNTYGGKLFDINMSEHIDPWRSTYYRDTKYKIYRAVPNEQLFERLQELYNKNPDGKLYQLNTTSIDTIFEKPIQELDTYLLNFLKQFGVRSKEFNDFKAKYGVDALGATDVLNKMIWYSKNKNVETIPEESAHMIVMLMGENNPTIKELLDNITDWSEYKNIEAEYMPEYNNLKQVKIEAVGKLIAKALVKNYKANGLNQSLLSKALKAINEFIEKLKTFFKDNLVAQMQTTDRLADHIAINVLMGNSDYIGNLRTSKPRLNYEEALKNNKFAQSIISNFTPLKAKITGSLALAAQGDRVYRSSEEPIHDIDFIVDNYDTFETILDKVDSLNGVPYHYGWDNAQKDFTTYAFLIPKEGHTVEVLERDFNKGNGWITKYNLRDREGKIVQASAQNVMAVDFFVYKEGRVEKGNPDFYASSSNIYKGKLTLSALGRNERLFQREKDQQDYLLSRPLTGNVSGPEFVYFQKNNTIQEINGVLFMDVNIDELQNERSREIAEVLAKRLALGTNTQYRNVTKEEAFEILKNRPVKYNGEPAFYYAGTVYTVGENVNVRTVLHEFSHPVLNALRKTNNILFQNLYNQALATEEGQGIYYYVQTNYPELDINSDLFKEEVLAYAMQLKSLNRINKELETEGYQSFMNKLFAAIKQLLRKLFGSKVKVDKLDVDTTLEELSDMLLDKEFEFNTDLITEDDLAMFSRDVLERAKELDKFSNKETSQKMVSEIYETSKRILNEAENFKGDKVARQFLRESLFEKGTNRYLRDVVRTLKDNLNTDTEGLSENEIIQNALDAAKKELDVDLQRATALVNSLDNINSMTKNMLSDISKIGASNINNRSTIALLMLYKSNSKAWLKMVREIDQVLSLDGEMIDSNNPFYKTLNEIVLNITRINTNIANILKNNNVQFYVEMTGYMSKYVQDRLKSNLGIALRRTFNDQQLEREVDDLYNKVIQQTLTDADIDALAQKGVPADILKGFLKEYKDLVVDEDKIKAALTGGAHDVTWFNRWLESYSSSNDVIVGPLAMFIQNEKTQVQNLVWEQSMKFRGKLEKLLPKVGFSKLNSIAMREKMGFKDKIFWVDKETGKPIEKEVWSYLGAFKDYRYHYDLLDYNVEEAKKTEDPAKISQAIMEFDEFKRDYMWQEFVPEFYEKDDLFKKSEIGKLAYYVRKQKLQAYNNLVNSMENELERLEKYSTIQASFREFQQLYSLTYEDGTSKVDDPANGVYDLSIAQILLEHRAATKDFYEWRPIEGMLQSAYNEFVDLLATKEIFPGSGDFDREIEKWRRQNLRMEYDQSYWDSRIKLITELKGLQEKMNTVANARFNVSEAFQTINDLIYTYRDEQGEPDSSIMGKTRLAKIRDLEQAIADFKFEYDTSSGLSKDESNELKDLQYKARKGLLKVGSAESKRYFELLDRQSQQGITPEDAARIQEIFSELSDLSQSAPTTHYIEALNYNLSKQNIKEVDEDELDSYINDEEFQDILNADEGFKEWFLLNHYTSEVYDEKSKSYVTKYKRTKANSVSVPKDESYIKFTKILDREGNEVLLMGSPNARHSRYEVKDKYRTIPFGAAKEDYVGKYIDNKNQWLPRLFNNVDKYSAKDSRFINDRYFQMMGSNSNEFQLLEAIKDYHLENQKGQSNYSKLYLDMPRYALKKGDIYQALQKGSYGQRFSELGANIKEWYKQALGKSVVDAENDLNYDPDNNLVNTDLDGNQITYVPVSGIYNLDINLQDADIFQGLFRYALSVRTQGKLLESLPLVNSILDTLEDPDNAPKDLEKFDKNIYNVKGILRMANKKFATNNRAGQVKSLIEREYYGKMVEGIEETHPGFGKWVQTLQGLSARGSLAINIQSDLKNKYGAYVQMIIEGAGAEFINLKDIALARPWAEKSMLEWSTKGIYQTGPGAISTQLIQIFDPNFKTKDQFGREVERSMVKDLVNMEWMYMHRKFGEMQVAVSLFGAFMYGQKVDQILSDGTKKTMRYLDAWEKDEDGIIRLKPGVHPGWSNIPVYHEYVKGETLESIAKKYHVPVEELKAKNRIKSEIQLEDGQEIVIAKSELFMMLKNRIQGTSRKLFGAYDEMGQPEGNKLLLYRMFFFMRKWFTPMFMNRFGFDSKTITWTRGGDRYDWATTSYGKGFYVTAFQVMLKTLKTGFRNYNYLTDEEKTAVRKASAEAFFAIGLSLLGLMIFGFDPDDDEKWKKLRAKSGAINQDTYNTYGFLSNHMLLLMMGVQGETSAFIPLPQVKGVNFGADDYTKMITQTTSAWYNTVVLYIDIFGDVLDFLTFSEMDRYKRDTGPYSWKEKGELKIWNKLGKTFGFTGSTGDPVTQFENMIKNQAKTQ